MEIWKKPYNLFLPTSAFVGIVTIVFLFSNKTSVAQNVYFYFYLENWHFGIFIVLVFFIQWIIYYMFSKYLYSHLSTWFHVIINIIFGIGIVVYMLQGGELVKYEFFEGESGKGYLAYFAFPLDSIATQLSIILFVSAQIIFVINLLFGIFKYLNSQEKSKL